MIKGYTRTGKKNLFLKKKTIKKTLLYQIDQEIKEKTHSGMKSAYV